MSLKPALLHEANCVLASTEYPPAWLFGPACPRRREAPLVDRWTVTVAALCATEKESVLVSSRSQLSAVTSEGHVYVDAIVVDFESEFGALPMAATTNES